MNLFLAALPPLLAGCAYVSGATAGQSLAMLLMLAIAVWGGRPR